MASSLLRVALLMAAGLAAVPTVAAAQGPMVGVIMNVEGLVAISPGEQPAHPFDWIAADTRIATGPRSSFVIVFASGARSKVKARSKVVISVGEVQMLSGGGVEGMLFFPPFPIRPVSQGGPAAEANEVDKALLKAFSDRVDAATDPDLMLLGAVVQLQWGMTSEGAALLARAKTAKADPKLVEALQKRFVR